MADPIDFLFDLPTPPASNPGERPPAINPGFTIPTSSPRAADGGGGDDGFGGPDNNDASAPIDLGKAYEEAFGYLERAVNETDPEAALPFYVESVNLFSVIRLYETEAKAALIDSEVSEMVAMVEELQAIAARGKGSGGTSSGSGGGGGGGGDGTAPELSEEDERRAAVERRAEFVLEQAIASDEDGIDPEAVAALYIDAAEALFELVGDAGNPNVARDRRRLTLALERAEELKGIEREPKSAPPAPSTSRPKGRTASLNDFMDPEYKYGGGFRSTAITGPSAGPSSTAAPTTSPVPRTRSSGAPPSVGGGGGGSSSGATRRPKTRLVAGGGRLSDTEKRILRVTSKINGKIFLPWIAQDLGEKFHYSEPFTDPDGFLPLSPKQRANFGGWARPHQFVRGADPVMIKLVSSYTVTQTLITDCSFVSSLAIASAYERRFKKQLITSIIYPQNRKREPVVNPSGKYMVKLHLNGIDRKVIIDDYLPVSKDGRLMCSHSTNRAELWISLIEKAFLKVHGGYDFPGSNSGIDLHILTGWIPEKLNTRDDEFDKNRAWNRIYNGQRYGDCLVTIATGDMSEAEADRLGLVPTHAYAVLELREINGMRMVQAKNPWAHLRWKGRFSHLDTQRWTPALQRALNYDAMTAMQVDNGVFWIHFDDVCTHFARIHINWSPDLFSHYSVLHEIFPKDLGPKNDQYSYAANPQYGIRVRNTGSNRPASVWVLLSKHVRTKDEKENNQDFLTMHVFKDTGAKRVYYPTGAAIRGTYINSPFYLVRFDVAARQEESYTVVVSQYLKVNTIMYTIKAYSTAPLAFEKIPVQREYERRVVGQWTASSAGGSVNHIDTFFDNPMFRLTLANPSPVILKLECPKDYAGNVKVYAGTDGRITRQTRPNVVVNSGDYRHGFAYAEGTLAAGVYVVVVSTFDPGQLGGYALVVGADSSDFSLEAL